MSNEQFETIVTLVVNAVIAANPAAITRTMNTGCAAFKARRKGHIRSAEGALLALLRMVPTSAQSEVEETIKTILAS
jgi:hypothetical protein